MRFLFCFFVLSNVAFGQIMEEYKVKLLPRPKTNDERINLILNDKDLLIYTSEEIPPAYQKWDSQIEHGQRVENHNGAYSVEVALGSSPLSNGNIEFPWDKPGGTSKSKNADKYTFILLPKDEFGKKIPIVWHKPYITVGNVSRSNNFKNRGYAWLFPIGTTIGEVMRVSSLEENIPFELRLRFRKATSWDVEVYRPFPTAEDLAEAIKKHRVNWKEDKSLISFVSRLEDKNLDLPKVRLKSDHPDHTVFDSTTAIDELPPLDKKLVTELLKTTLFSSVESPWRTLKDGTPCHAPTTKEDWHIVPQNYEGGFISVDSESCIRCHNSVNNHLEKFDRPREWYGRIRGSDGIFSFHPFEPSKLIKKFDKSLREIEPEIRKSFIEAGIVEKFDPKKHTTERYKAIFSLGELAKDQNPE